MDIRLDVNPSVRAAYLKNQTEASKAQTKKSPASTPRSRDVVDISRKSSTASAAKSGTAASEGVIGREHGFWTKDGKIDNSETTFTSIFATIGPVEKALEARGEAGIGRYLEPAWVAANQVVRDQISHSIQELLAKNGITIPEGQSFELGTSYVDDLYHIDVYGLDDPELTEAVEKALNVGNNGFYLNQHYHWSSMITGWVGLTGQSSQDLLSQEKESLYHMVQDLSGYDIRTLRREDGQIFTPDGQDLWSVLLEKAAQFKIPDAPEGEVGINIDQYWDIYLQIAKMGWDSIPDPEARFLYKDGYLYDIGTPYGYGPGQQDWQDWVRENAAEIAAKRFAQMEQNLRSQPAAASAAWSYARTAVKQEEPAPSEEPEEPTEPEKPEEPDIEEKYPWGNPGLWIRGVWHPQERPDPLRMENGIRLGIWPYPAPWEVEKDK